MYVGLDVHKKVCYGTVMDEKGNVVKQARFDNDHEALDGFMKGLEEARVVMEAGYCWQPLYDRLEEAGHDVRLAHPKGVKSLTKKKTDRTDSEALAHLLRTDLLPESYVPPRDIKMLRDRVRRRSFLVGMRTKVKNRIRAELAKRRIRLGANPWTREGRMLLQSLELEAVDQVMPVMLTLERQIGRMSLDLKHMCGENPQARLLTTIPGVGYYIALLIVSEIGDVNRFGSSESLCSYAGLIPSVSNSADKVRHGSITKEGSRWMRWALVQAVHVHIRYDTELSRFYHRLVERKKSQEAAVATARKILKAVYWMLKLGEEHHSGGYDPKERM